MGADEESILWSAVAERSGDTALAQNRQGLRRPSAITSQSAVAVRLTTDFAGALHRAVPRFAVRIVDMRGPSA